jgi:tRNA dimethylallyltransferase
VILALVGPTASGKTRLALSLAPALGAEVVSVDSMQVYRGMDAGTAKPTAEERARVPHHMLDVAAPGEPFSVAEFQRASQAALRDVESRGRVAMLVGGSGLYFRAVVDSLTFPPTDPAVRARLEAEDGEALWRRLQRSDPAAATRIQPQNKRRIARALEVAEITGRPFSSFRTAWDRYDLGVVLAAALHVPSDVMRRRVEKRTRAMFAGPILDEARTLRDAGVRAAVERTAAIGYREAFAVLDGAIAVEEAVQRAVRDTLRLARRQLRWFRRDPRLRWVDAEDLDRAEAELGAYWQDRTIGVGSR